MNDDGRNPRLEPDEDQIRLFTAALFRRAGVQYGFASVRSFLDDDDSNKPFRITPTAMAGGLEFLNEVAIDDARRAANAPRKVVFCPPLATFAHGTRAGEDDIVEGLVLSVECDQHPREARAKLEHILGDATVVVYSGGQWTDPVTHETEPKLHGHWRLEVPARSHADLLNLKQARDLAARLVGGDPTNKAVCHPIRWPGSWHRKGEPRLCEIAAMDNEQEIDLGTALKKLKAAAELEGLFASKPNGGRPANANGAGYELPDGGWEELIAGILSGEDYHNATARLAMMLLNSGMSDGAAVNLLRGWMNASAGARDGRWQARHDDIPRAVSTARAKVGDGQDEPSDGGERRAVPLTTSEWLARQFPPRDLLMGHWLTTTSRILLSADTGLGKSSLVLAILVHIAAGLGFLHWKCGRPARVLFIDGEMSGEWLQVMIADAVRRMPLGVMPEMHFLNRDDYPGMPPLNTKEGYAWLRGYVETNGHYDFIAFDNIMSLSVGNPKDPEAWQAMLDLVAYLTRIRTGQLWINHTGHDASRSYGDKAKEWRMTSVIHLDVIERPDTDVSFELKFVKKRESTPLNRADFQTVRITLINDRWVCNAADQHRTAPKENSPADNILRALRELSAGADAVETDGGWRAVPTSLWRKACIGRGYCAGATPKTQESFLYRVRTQLVNTHNVKVEGELAWAL